MEDTESDDLRALACELYTDLKAARELVDELEEAIKYVGGDQRAGAMIRRYRKRDTSFSELQQEAVAEMTNPQARELKTDSDELSGIKDLLGEHPEVCLEDRINSLSEVASDAGWQGDEDLLSYLEMKLKQGR